MCGGEGEVLKKGGESRIGRAKLEATTVNYLPSPIESARFQPNRSSPR